MLGDGEAADATERAARAAAPDDRVRALAAAAVACRTHDGPASAAGPAADASDAANAAAAEDSAHAADAATAEPPATLAAAVAGELAAATARLPERQREALALRELLALPYAEIASVVGIEPVAVAPLLARARLRLRGELRESGPQPPPCDERERALRAIALRQDGEPLADADEDWLLEHLGHCVGCARAHAAMLEASACYRAWRLEDDAPAEVATAPEPAPTA